MAAKTSVGLEVRADQLRLVALTKLSDGVRVECCLTMTLPEVTGESALRQIRTWLAERLPPKREAVLAIAGGSAFVRGITVLPIKEKTLEQAIGYEAEQQIPFSLQEVEWDWCSLGSSGEGGTRGQTRAILVAVKKEIVEGGLRQAMSFGVTAGAMDLASLAMYNTARRVGVLRQETPSVIVCVEQDSTDLLILQAGSRADSIPEFWVRSLPFGLNQGEEALGDLVGEIKRSVDFRLGEAGELGQVLLCGEGAGSQALLSAMREALDVLIEPVDPFRSVVKGSGSATIPEGAERSPYTVAMGLALRGLGPVPLEVNLAKRWAEVNRQRKERQTHALGVGVLSVLLILSGVWSNWGQIQSKQEAFSQLNQKLAGYEQYSPQIAELQKEVVFLQERTEWLVELAKKKELALKVLDNGSEALPEGVWIADGNLEVPVSQGQWGEFAIRGMAPDYESVNSFVGTLRASPRLRDVKPISSTLVKPTDGNSEEVVEFSITAGLREL
ncbi:MAG: pilus assembly protein PilM [Candidatus Omnitrophica bacterium]|nr:pilus assembly protein PilM [Candidatus Omnitrophota bacterium]